MKRGLMGEDDDAYGVVVDAASDLGLDLDQAAGLDLSEFKDLELPEPETLDDALRLGSAVRSDIRTGLNAEQSLSAKEMAGLRKAGFEIDRQLFDNDISDHIQSRRLQKLKPVYDREYGDRFDIENAVSGQTPGQQIASRFWKPDTKNGAALAQWYRFVFNQHPQALDDFGAAAIDDLRRHVGTDSTRVGTWKDMHKQALRSFPEIEGMVKEDPLAAMSVRARDAAATADAVGDTRLRKRLQDLNLKPSLDEIAKVVGVVGGDDHAMAALRRGIWSAAAAADPTASGLEKFGRDRVQELKRAMTKDHYQDLMRVVGGIRMGVGGDAEPTDSLHHYLPGMGPDEGRMLMRSAYADAGVAADLAGAVSNGTVNSRSYRRLTQHLLNRGL